MKTRHEPNPTITNSDGILFFYTRREAANHAASIGWPKNSARKVSLPFGRVRYCISDPHCNVLLAPVQPVTTFTVRGPLVDDPEDIRMSVENVK